MLGDSETSLVPQMPRESAISFHPTGELEETLVRTPQWEERCGLSINTHKLDSRLAVKVGQPSVLLSAPSWLLVMLYCARVLFYMLFQAGRCH